MITLNMITELREITGLSQQQIADYAGITRTLLSMAECGDRKLPTVAWLRLNQLHHLATTLAPAPDNGAVLLLTDNTLRKKALQAQLAKCRQQMKRYYMKLEFNKRRLRQNEVLLLLAERLQQDITGGEKGEELQLWLNAAKATVRASQSPLEDTMHELEWKLLRYEANVSALEQMLDGIS